jgi:hypothetical protein
MATDVVAAGEPPFVVVLLGPPRDGEIQQLEIPVDSEAAMFDVASEHVQRAEPWGRAVQRWRGRLAPKGGRPPGYTGSQVERVRQLRQTTDWGYDTIAADVGLSRETVRRILR